MQHVESIEARTLFAVDLSIGALSAPKLPSSVEVTAISKAAIPVKVAVTNTGDEVLGKKAAPVTVAFVLAKAGGAEVALASKVVKVASLKVGKAVNLTVPIKLPQNLTTGDYSLVVRLDTTGALAESNEANNAVTGSVVKLVPGGTALFATYGFADRITFTSTDFVSAANGSTDTGRWVDANGVTGGYNLVVAKLGSFRSTSISIFRDGFGIDRQYAAGTIVKTPVFGDQFGGKTIQFSGKAGGTKITGGPTAAGTVIYAKLA